MSLINLYSKTDIGKQRTTNEDNAAALMIRSQIFKNELNCGVLVVADGMGGHELGEVASAIAIKTFIETVTENILYSSQIISEIKFGDILIKAAEVINNEILQLSAIKEKRIGSTLVGAIIAGNKVFIVNIGDSRAYLIKPGVSIVQITKDHTIVQDLLDSGAITEDQAKNHPKRHFLTKALGLDENIQLDIFVQELTDEIILLCSDGLHGALDDHEILQLVTEDIAKSGDRLVSLANQNGGIDNISVALACNKVK